MNVPLLEDDYEAIRQPEALRREWLVRAFVFFAAFALLVTNAGSFGLWDCWETHYGEVARYMHERGDLLSPWWGYKEQIGSEPPTGEWFFSKPVLIMYGEILFLKLLGLSEWSFRLPWALLGTLGVFSAYVIFARIYGRRAGLFSAFILLSTPYWFFLSRQAITDMPFVGTMTIGLMFFMLAYFGPAFKTSNKMFWFYFLTFLAVFLLVSVPQFIMLALDLEPDATYENFGPLMRAWLIFQKTGIYHTVIYFVVTAILLLWIFIPLRRDAKSGRLDTHACKDAWLRKIALWTAYMFLGLATLGKGLLGFMLPGAILFLYLLLTGEWRALKRLEIGRGIIVMCLVMLPWYLGMLAKHGEGFYARFFVHDHFNRLGTGVHQIDTGTFEHFIKWLSIGSYGWIGLVPLLLLGAGALMKSHKDPKEKGMLFLFIWGFFAYVLFTLSATKFHHYIFPAIPPTALLLGIYLSHYLDDRSIQSRLIAIIAVTIVVAVGYWIYSDPQSFRNMFTYQYDRQFPQSLPIDPNAPVAPGSTKTWAMSTFYEHTNSFIKALLQTDFLEYETFTGTYMAVIAVIFLCFAFFRLRRYAVYASFVAQFLLAFWCLNYYMPMISPSWSQKYIFEDYFKNCHLAPNPDWVDDVYQPILSKIGLSFIPEYFGAKPKRVCQEDVVAWLITWRGETFYTSSEIKPLMKATQLEPYLQTINKGRTFFALTQASRGQGLKGYLDRATTTLKNKGVPEFVGITGWDVEVLHEESQYFSLVRATPKTSATEIPVKEEEEKGEMPELKVDSPPAM